MFEEFLFLLRRNGLHVSLTEWMTLMQALHEGLHESSFQGFYQLCRCVLVKTEADFDKFDRVFLEYFGKIETEPEVSQKMLDWLNNPNAPMGEYDELQAELNQSLSHTEIEFMLQERIHEQREQHNCGNHWVGTHGMSVFGNDGMSPTGIRVGGTSQHRSAFRVAGERRFRDFRNDNTLDTRQFQVALRKLRQYSGLLNQPESEFDVDNTIKDTAGNGGVLKVRYKRPRENTIKVLLLMDSGGSMEYYSQLCSALFRAVSKVGHFQDLKVYYFHNCIYSKLFLDPRIDPNHSISTQWVLDNISSDHRVIIIGDAQMDPHELVGRLVTAKEGGPACGQDWLNRIKDRYSHVIWLNPSERPDWGEIWSESYDMIEEMFHMLPLSVDGLEEGMKRLLVR